MSDGGKGSNRRPTDMQKFGSNYDTIFGGGVRPITQDDVDGLNKVLDKIEDDREEFDNWVSANGSYLPMSGWKVWLGALKTKGVSEAETTRPFFDDWYAHVMDKDWELYDAWYSARTWLEVQIEAANQEP